MELDFDLFDDDQTDEEIEWDIMMAEAEYNEVEQSS